MNNEKFNLLKNIRFSVISFAINIALIFISYRLVIKYDGIDSLGLWSLLLAWAALTRIGDVGMGGAILRFISTKNLKTESDQIRVLIDTGFIMNFVIFFILTLLGYSILDLNLSSIVDLNSYERAKSILPIMFIGIFLSSLTSVLTASLQGLHHGYIGSYLTVGGNIIQIIYVLILVPDMGILGLAWAQLIQYSILTLVAWVIVNKKIGIGGILPLHFSFMVLREMLSFSLKAQVANITNGFFEPLSKILISQFGDFHIQGLYELAYKTVSLARNVIISGLFASLPTLTNLINENPHEARNFYLKSQKNIIRAISVGMLIVIIFSPLVSLVWVEQFEKGYWFFVICIAIGFWINTLGAVAYSLGLATGKMKNNIISTVATLLVLFITGYFMGYLFEDQGVGVATSLSLAFGGVLIKILNEKLIFKDARENING